MWQSIPVSNSPLTHNQHHPFRNPFDNKVWEVYFYKEVCSFIEVVSMLSMFPCIVVYVSCGYTTTVNQIFWGYSVWFWLSVKRRSFLLIGKPTILLRSLRDLAPLWSHKNTSWFKNSFKMIVSLPMSTVYNWSGGFIFFKEFFKMNEWWNRKFNWVYNRLFYRVYFRIGPFSPITFVKAL